MRLNRLTIRIFSIIVAGILLLCFSGCTKTESETDTTVQTTVQTTAQSTKQEILEDMITCYGTYGDEAEETVAGYLDELKSIDKKAYKNWNAIMEHWKFDESSSFKINYYVLPDGLAKDDSLAIIAFGYALNDDGSIREALTDRLKVVLNSALKYPNALIVVTGGHTASANSEASEAGKMAEWLIEKGIDSDRILIEDASLTTAQNAKNTYELLQSEHPEVNKLALISSDYHLSACDAMVYANLVLKAGNPDKIKMKIVSNAASKGDATLSDLFTANGLVELANAQ